MHVLSDANGLPLVVGVSSANVHDSEGLKPMVAGHQTRHDPHNGRHFKPQRLHADKAYDIPHLRKWLRGKRIGVRIARKGIESSERLGRRRWVIERTMSWLSGYRRLSPPLRASCPQLPGLSRPRRRPLLLQAIRTPHHIGHRLRRYLIWLGKLPVVVGIVERLVPDEWWELFQRVVPEAPSRPQGGGRRRHGDREVLAAIVFVATSGCTWQQLPSASFGPSGATAHRRFAEWTKARVWAKLHRLVLDELGSRGELDWSRCAIDSVNTRALKRGT
jgi:transposase